MILMTAKNFKDKNFKPWIHRHWYFIQASTITCHLTTDFGEFRARLRHLELRGVRPIAYGRLRFKKVRLPWISSEW